MIDLCSGKGGLSAAFVKRGHEVVTVDINKRFSPTIVADVLKMQPEDAPGPWDVVLAGPPCEAFSVAALSHHWGGGWRAYKPITEHAKMSIRLVERILYLIDEWNPAYWTMENPRGVLRKLPMMRPFDRRTVTYCQYGDTRMKPTDLWGRFPVITFKPVCANGRKCHEAAPRGSKTGTQGIKGADNRAVVPYDLSLALCVAMETAL